MLECVRLVLANTPFDPEALNFALGYLLTCILYSQSAYLISPPPGAGALIMRCFEQYCPNSAFLLTFHNTLQEAPENGEVDCVSRRPHPGVQQQVQVRGRLGHLGRNLARRSCLCFGW